MWLADLAGFANSHNYSLAQARLLQCTAEHLRARQDGGKNSPGNIAAACWYCNTRRHKRVHQLRPEEFRQHVVKRMRNGRWHQLS
ncbi:HNH endonuclease [Azospira sp.]|uniref:HNH endonuclease n=1 Tax=Azospira sp. TaxID=1872671 RepID=UPI0039C86DC5